MARATAPLLSVQFRVGLVATALLAGGLLLVAASLEPSPRGFGTHQQLGLGPCWIFETTGVRCPSCGMTTAWAYLAQGDLLRALKTHVGGTLAAALTAVALPWMLLAAYLGHWPGIRPTGLWMLVGVSTWLGIVLLDWGARMLCR